MLHIWTNRFQRFGGICCLDLQGRRVAWILTHLTVKCYRHVVRRVRPANHGSLFITTRPKAYTKKISTYVLKNRKPRVQHFQKGTKDLTLLKTKSKALPFRLVGGKF
jgi:hypothetical protein